MELIQISHFKMHKKRIVKKTCLLFGEGSREKIFFNFLTRHQSFKDRFPNWWISQDNAHGESCRDVLLKCIHVLSEREYDLVLCFIDTDKLYEDFPKKHKLEKKELESIASEKNVVVIWQDKNHEDELLRATNGKISSKNGMKGKLERHAARVLSSEYVKNILSFLRD
jgi:hypothetical protein